MDTSKVVYIYFTPDMNTSKFVYIIHFTPDMSTS